MKIQDEAENRVINPEVVSEDLVQGLNEAMAGGYREDGTHIRCFKDRSSCIWLSVAGCRRRRLEVLRGGF